MENSRNSNSHEDEENKQSINGSLNTEQFFQGLFRSSISIDGISGQNLPVINQLAAETEPMRQQQSGGQRQPADISSADSHSRRNITQIITPDKRARKRKNDKAYRERVKERQQRMKSTVETLEVENELLKTENVLVKQQFQTQSGEIDVLRNNSDELHQKLIKQLENEKLLKFNLETLEAENGLLKSEKESLKEENVLVKQRFQAQSAELDALRNNFDELNQKFMKQLENEQQMKFNLKTLEAENESLKIEKASVNRKLETLSNEFDKLKKQHEKTHEMKLNVETLEAENGQLKSEKESLKEETVLVNQRFDTQSKQLDELRKNIDELNQKIIKQFENELQMKYKLNTLEAEYESLKSENALVNRKYEKTHARKQELKANLQALQAENGKLKDEIIVSAVRISAFLMRESAP